MIKKATMRTSAFARHVYAVQRYVTFTAPRYAPLMKASVRTHPICCFGEIESAKVVTVGLNPSIGEFSRGRWPAEIEHSILAERCANYFKTGPAAESHVWFEPWIEGLELLNCSYEKGEAVHIDLSPRATRVVRDLKDAAEQSLFLEMVERDLWTFFASLDLCQNAKLVVIAGSVTGKYYINEFLQRFAPEHGYRLDGDFNRLNQQGSGKTAKHVLTNGTKRLPVFFCSSSPSAKDKRLLPQRIGKHAAALKQGMENSELWFALNGPV